MKTLAVIPARGNSKGIPNKNLAVVAGSPLLYWTIKAAKSSKKIDFIAVSSESQEILDYAKGLGVETIKRPELYSEDGIHASVPCIHALGKKPKRYDAIIMLLPTSPLRTNLHIDAALEMFEKTKSISVVSITPTASMHSHRYYDTETLELSLPNKYYNLNAQRQDVKELYRVNGAIFITTPQNLIRYNSFHRPATYGYLMSNQDSVDVNNYYDLELADILLRDRDAV